MEEKNNNKILEWSPHLSCFQTDVTVRTLHPTTGFVIYTCALTICTIGVIHITW